MIESSNPIQPLTKIVVARAQLVTALDLFVRDKDPISIQCLLIAKDPEKEKPLLECV
jgi:hypothetical protein